MYLEIFLAFFIFRYMRKSLIAGASLPKWDKILMAGMAVSLVLLVLEITAHNYNHITIWIAHAVLLSLVYLIFGQKELSFAKPLLFAVLPYIALSFLSDLVMLISPVFYNDWNDYFDTANVFAIIWMIAMWFITRRQNKALEKEQVKTKEIEKENRITESLKAALEIQVSERTAALTIQKEELQLALDELKSTQAQLIQAEKMASLGELTAGIAHEIQNPLNFVNNFSEINTELIAEMKGEIEKGNIEDVKSIANDIAANEQKINHHGKRADAIVKGMLQHSRTSNGVKELTDINALADEYLRLAYHGLRAKDKSFNATIKTSYDKSLANINIVPQEIGRVILNLITNAFYSVAEKKNNFLIAIDKTGFNPIESASGQIKYEPTVSVTTSLNPASGSKNGEVIISVKDNGNGVPQKVLDKIFQPFFTTKPTGQGTGLGLSLSYDIVKAHGGELKVVTKEGESAEFIIILPQ